MAENENNLGVAMVQLKSRSHPERNANVLPLRHIKSILVATFVFCGIFKKC